MMSISDNERSINQLQDILVSVIIPVYNAEKTLHKCLKSVVQQTHSKMQIILVNDGSTDLSEEICMSFYNEDQRIEYYRKENGGVSSARNLGISKVKGKYLQFVDADDFIDHDLIASSLCSITETDSDVLVYGLVFEYSSYHRCTHFDSSALKRFRKGGFKEYVISLQDKGLLGYACNKLYKAAHIENYLIKFNEDIPLYEDLLFNCEFLKHACSIDIAPFCKYHYVQSSNSASVKHDSNDLFCAEQALSEVLDLLQHCDVDQTIIKRLLFKFAYYSIKSYMLRLGLPSYHIFAERVQVIFEYNLLKKYLYEAPEYISSLTIGDRANCTWIMKRRTWLVYCTVISHNFAKNLFLIGNERANE